MLKINMTSERWKYRYIDETQTLRNCKNGRDENRSSLLSICYNEFSIDLYHCSTNLHKSSSWIYFTIASQGNFYLGVNARETSLMKIFLRWMRRWRRSLIYKMLRIIIVNVTCYQFRQITLKQVFSDCNNLINLSMCAYACA